MAYRISGLDPARFSEVDALVAAGAIRKIADAPHACPRRVTLEDALPGKAVPLLNFVSADVHTPFRARHAIYVREGAEAAPVYRDAVPDYLDRRMLSLRGLDSARMVRAAAVARPGSADGGLRNLLDDGKIAYVDARNAAYGCFLARAERCDD